jgi:hypothetical protein
MFICGWSFDLQYGTRDQALKLLHEFKDGIAKSGWLAKRTRILAGSIGVPESRIVIEHEFESLAALESSWEALHKQSELFGKMVSQLKGVIVSGTPRWEIYRVLDAG